MRDVALPILTIALVASCAAATILWAPHGRASDVLDVRRSL